VTVPQGRYVGGGAAKHGEDALALLGGAVDTAGLDVATATVADAGGVLATGGFGAHALLAITRRTLTQRRKASAISAL
jgi:hypothetical protein